MPIKEGTPFNMSPSKMITKKKINPIPHFALSSDYCPLPPAERGKDTSCPPKNALLCIYDPYLH